jgi:DNA-binding transcriptional regulator YiaG
MAGFPVILEAAAGWRCSRCKQTSLPGIVINHALVVLAMHIVQAPRRLTKTEARYLRRFLLLSLPVLALRMGISQRSIVEWERGRRDISTQNDFILRAIVVAKIADDDRIDTLSFRREVAGGLLFVRRAQAPKRQPQVMIRSIRLVKL